MSEFLLKIKDVMTGSKSKSKRPSRGSDSWDYGNEFGPNTGGLGSRLDYEPFCTNDYGKRLGSYGTKLRPGTYGLGDYTLRSNGLNYNSTNGYNYTSNTGTYGSANGVLPGRAFGGGDAAGSSSYNHGPGNQIARSYGYGSRDKMVTNSSRSRW